MVTRPLDVIVRPSISAQPGAKPGASLVLQVQCPSSSLSLQPQNLPCLAIPIVQLTNDRCACLILFVTEMWPACDRKRKASNEENSRSVSSVGEIFNNNNKTSSARRSSSEHASESGSMDVHGGDWSVAESKSSRKKRRKIERHSDDYPGINFLKTRPERVDLKALQDLVLYVLADGTAPSWLAVNNAKKIEKAVVLMVPGLDREMLHNSEFWDSMSKENNAKNSSSDKLPSLPADPALRDEAGAQSNASPIDSPSDLESSPPTTGPMTPRDSLLEHILQVRAPGDSSMSRIHSPLQHMLIAPFSSKQKTKSGKEEKSFHAVRTPIAEFVHSADDLRDAEYPIHPAAFENPDEARLEQERRETTGQSTSAGWVDTDVKICALQKLRSSPGNGRDPLAQGLKPYALDCEMVLTTDDKYSLARISLVDWSGGTILDKYVKPSLPIKNYFTEFSGITEEILKNVTTTLEDIQKELLVILRQDSILLGHSLESDLNALKLTHPFVVDTSIIYPHPRGLPLRSSLKFLANRYLKREIQKGGLQGHDSVEDARAVLDLVKLKCEKGPRWGTLDANGESIFRRISGTPKMDERKADVISKTSAIVEYGTPERGLGKEATYHIACENDDEIVRGILRAASGETTFHHAEDDGGAAEQKTEDEEGKDSKDSRQGERAFPPHGVDFIWSRLRDLEAVRGWNVLPSDSSTTTRSSSTSASGQSFPEDRLETAKLQTLRRIFQIYTSLPPRALFIVYSGTSDLRPLLRLQKLHAQYKREFKVKKWDELSVKWTDTEEQAMKKACESARRGVGILAMTRSLGEETENA